MLRLEQPVPCTSNWKHIAGRPGLGCARGRRWTRPALVPGLPASKAPAALWDGEKRGHRPLFSRGVKKELCSDIPRNQGRKAGGAAQGKLLGALTQGVEHPISQALAVSTGLGPPLVWIRSLCWQKVSAASGRRCQAVEVHAQPCCVGDSAHATCCQRPSSVPCSLG